MGKEQNGLNDNIYENGTYINNNPALHAEDSDYKFEYIKKLISSINFSGNRIKVLDVGGGAGLIAAKTCRYLTETQGKSVDCHALDISSDILDVQCANNNYISKAMIDIGEAERESGYDLVLLIDVIEHMIEHHEIAEKINNISRNIIYNIPIEKNIMDFLRNIYMRGEYYGSQTLSLGHVHFFSSCSAKRFVSLHHKIVDSIFAEYSGHILNSNHPDYLVQKSNKFRKLELKFSHFFYRFFKYFAPFLIQGSIFFYVKGRG